MQPNEKSENYDSSVSKFAVPVLFIAVLFALLALLSEL
jgi:hypothetical protein